MALHSFSASNEANQLIVTVSTRLVHNLLVKIRMLRIASTCRSLQEPSNTDPPHGGNAASPAIFLCPPTDPSAKLSNVPVTETSTGLTMETSTRPHAVPISGPSGQLLSTGDGSEIQPSTNNSTPQQANLQVPTRNPNHKACTSTESSVASKPTFMVGPEEWRKATKPERDAIRKADPEAYERRKKARARKRARGESVPSDEEGSSDEEATTSDYSEME